LNKIHRKIFQDNKFANLQIRKLTMTIPFANTLGRQVNRSFIIQIKSNQIKLQRIKSSFKWKGIITSSAIHNVSYHVLLI